MALKPCSECGKEVSTDAKACPHCGAKPPKHTSVLTWIFGGFFTLIVYSCVSSTMQPTTSATTTAAPKPGPQVPIATISTPSTQNSGTANQRPSTPPSKWKYEIDDDKMSGGKTKYARLDSSNTLSFSFPYGGHNQPTVTLRKNPSGGVDTLLQVDKGQFICSYPSCSVKVKFDDKAPIRFTANGPSDHSTTTLFISPAAKFIAGLKSAKATHIEAVFYHEGSRVMSFDTAGLIWK